jgi:hypothetical protein
MDRKKNLAAFLEGNHPEVPHVVYHGSPDVRGIVKEGFKPFSRGNVFFATDNYRMADSYADPKRAFDYQNAEPHVIPLHLSLKNPMVIDAQGRHWKETERHVAEAKAKGHDGMIIKNSVDYYNNPKKGGNAGTVFAWFNPTQAKSAIEGKLNSRFDDAPIPNAVENQGTFDPSEPDITKKRGGTVETKTVDVDHPNFRSWFGNSVAHNEGKPRRYFTGTSKDVDFPDFKVSRHGAWFTTDPQEASGYAEQNDSQDLKYDPENRKYRKINTASRVVPAYLKAENPYTGEKPEHIFRVQNYKKAQSDWFDTLRSQGYDSWVPESQGGNLAVILGHPGQIKSAISNTGDFDPNQKRIDRADGGEVDDYRGQHEAPGPDSGAPLHDTTNVYPKDFYGPNGFRYYGDHGNHYDINSYNTTRRLNGNPNDYVWIHRAVPKDVYAKAMKTDAPLSQLIKKGDWVTPSKEYAHEHGQGPLNGDYKIASKRVKAKEVFTNGDSIHEWGYHPEVKKAGGGATDDDGITAYHASPKQLNEFKPSGFRGSTFFASTPKRAMEGAGAGANEMVMDTATELKSGPMFIHKVNIDPSKIAGLHYTPAEKEWFHSMPSRIVGDDALEEAMGDRPNPYISWDDIYNHHKVGDRLYEYRKRKEPPSVSYEQAYKTGKDVYGRQHSHYAPEGDEKKNAQKTLATGMKGHLVHDEAGLSIAMADPSHAKIKDVKHFANGGALDGEDEGITAYHGSPHDFEEFDTSKIGSGEGAQAYGHGLYFAENEGVAKGYRDKLSIQADPRDAINDVVHQFKVGRVSAPTRENIENWMSDNTALKDYVGNDHIVSRVHEVINADNDDDAFHSYRELDNLLPPPSKGHMYEVHIDAHPDHFLDWDAPLDSHPEVHSRIIQAVRDKAASSTKNKSAWSSLAQEVEKRGDETFGHHLQDALIRPSGIGLSPKEASDFLSSAGVHGIKYLDAASRNNTEKPTRNYVVFDHDRVAVKRKYARGGVVG